MALDLTGQLQRLDSYFVEARMPPPESAGDWHTKCLRESALGEAWFHARLRNFTATRGYVVVAALDSWTVLEHPRRGSRLGLGTHGALLELPRTRELIAAEGGFRYRERTAEYNLHLPDAHLVETMQQTLVRDGACSMSMMFERLGLWPHLEHPELLVDARFVYDEDLREDWGAEWLAAVAECDVFIPRELAPLCT